MKIGLLGLPLSGKTAFFNLLTGAGAATSAFAGARESHVGVARVPDARVDFLSRLFQPRKTTYAQIEVLDIPGLTRDGGAAALADPLRDADALVVVLRGFTNPAVGIGEEPAALRDLSKLMAELILTDLAVVEKRLERLAKGKRRAVSSRARKRCCAAPKRRWKRNSRW
jgi:hypothetical protein